MRQPFVLTGLCLTLFHVTVSARAYIQLPVSDNNALAEGGSSLSWVLGLFKERVERRQSSQTCYEDTIYKVVDPSFCAAFMKNSNSTVIVDYTPTSTYTDDFTTSTITVTEETHTTVGTTTTVTDTLTMGKRAEITARAELSESQVARIFAQLQRQYAVDNSSSNNSSSSSMSIDDAQSFSSALSSACNCHNYPGAVVTSTYTDNTATTTLVAFDLTTTTTTLVHNAGTTETTTTVYVSPLAATTSSSTTSASTSTSTSTPPSPASGANSTVPTATSPSAQPTPTSPVYSCPDDNGEMVSQMVGPERFDYVVMCGTWLTSSNFYTALRYSTYSQCLGACSWANANFSSPVCQGVSYAHTYDADGYNCYLKTSGNGSTVNPNYDSATLQRIVFGLDSTDLSGTSTEAAPFDTATPTARSGEMSSSVSSNIGDSSSAMPIITPGPQIPISGMLVNMGPQTYYSTYISQGSTYSSGTTFSTSYTSGSEWYVSYYASSTEVWSSAITVYGISAQQTQVSNSSTVSSSVQSNENGGYSEITITNTTTYYPGGENVTEVIRNQTFAANGTEITSSATTLYFSYATGSAGGSNGSAQGAAASGAITSGPISSPMAQTTLHSTLFSTETIISNYGNASGASAFAGSGVVGSGLPVTSSTVIVFASGIASSTEYIFSGAIRSTANSTGNVQATSAVIVSSYGIGVHSSYLMSGQMTPTPTIIVTTGSSAFVTSGAITSSSINVTSTLVILNTENSAGSSGFAANGTLGGFVGQTGTLLSGPISSSTSAPFADTGVPRQGTYTPPNGPTITTPLTGPGYVPPSSEASPANSSSFTDTGVPRVGSYSTSSLLATGPAPYPPSSDNSSGNGMSGIPSPTAVVPTGPLEYGPPGTGFPIPYSFLPPGHAPFIPASSPSAGFNISGAGRNGSYPTSVGTAPPGTISPLSWGPIYHPPPSPVAVPSAPSSGAPSVPIANGTAPPFENTGAPRTGGFPTPTAGSFNNTGAPSGSPYPTPTMCSNLTIAATTIWQTTTVLGCFASCAPGGYGYGSPQAFGPPWAEGSSWPQDATTSSTSTARVGAEDWPRQVMEERGGV